MRTIREKTPPMQGADVRALQVALARNPLGAAFDRVGFDPGPVDGIAGPKTLAAIEQAKYALGYKTADRKGGALLLAFLERRRRITPAMRKRRVARIERHDETMARKPKVVRPKWSWRYPLLPRIGKVVYFICHYSASSAATTAVAMHEFHRSKGFAGLGYCAVIEANGTIVIGRGWNRRGAHTLGWNDQWAVCVPGNDEAPPTKAQVVSLQWLIANREEAAGRQLIVRGHREMPGNATSCPGKYWPWKGVC